MAASLKTTIRDRLAALLGLRREPFYYSCHLWSGTTLDAWRSSDTRVSYAQSLFRHPLFREMLSVLNNTLPVPDVSDASRAALEGARVRGYQQAVAVLLQMAKPLETPGPAIEANYDTPVENLEPTEE